MTVSNHREKCKHKECFFYLSFGRRTGYKQNLMPLVYKELFDYASEAETKKSGYKVENLIRQIGRDASIGFYDHPQ